MATICGSDAELAALAVLRDDGLLLVSGSASDGGHEIAERIRLTAAARGAPPAFAGTVAGSWMAINRGLTRRATVLWAGPDRESARLLLREAVRQGHGDRLAGHLVCSRDFDSGQARVSWTQSHAKALLR